MRPRSLRSTQVRYAKAPRTRLTTRSALMTSIHQGSFNCSGMRHLDALVQSLRVLLFDPHHTGQEAAVDTGGERVRRAVRADANRLAGRDAPLAGIRRRELDLGQRALELELRDALHRLAAEEPAVADDLETSSGAGALARSRRPHMAGVAPGRKRSALVGKLSGPAVHRDPKAGREVGEECELVLDLWVDGTAEPLRTAFKVDRR